MTLQHSRIPITYSSELENFSFSLLRFSSVSYWFRNMASEWEQAAGWENPEEDIWGKSIEVEGLWNLFSAFSVFRLIWWQHFHLSHPDLPSTEKPFANGKLCISPHSQRANLYIPPYQAPEREPVVTWIRKQEARGKKLENSFGDDIKRI